MLQLFLIHTQITWPLFGSTLLSFWALHSPTWLQQKYELSQFVFGLFSSLFFSFLRTLLKPTSLMGVFRSLNLWTDCLTREMISPCLRITFEIFWCNPKNFQHRLALFSLKRKKRRDIVPFFSARFTLILERERVHDFDP